MNDARGIAGIGCIKGINALQMELPLASYTNIGRDYFIIEF
jgi:hypothetical protein